MTVKWNPEANLEAIVVHPEPTASCDVAADCREQKGLVHVAGERERAAMWPNLRPPGS
jgi:hypothetical protein